MNKREAESRGYVFTGWYSHNKEEISDRVKELRKEGNKAVIVTIPRNPLSRSWHGTGWSAYWIESEKNKVIREAAAKERTKIRLLKNKEELLLAIANIDKELASL